MERTFIRLYTRTHTIHVFFVYIRLLNAEVCIIIHIHVQFKHFGTEEVEIQTVEKGQPTISHTNRQKGKCSLEYVVVLRAQTHKHSNAIYTIQFGLFSTPLNYCIHFMKHRWMIIEDSQVISTSPEV